MSETTTQDHAESWAHPETETSPDLADAVFRQGLPAFFSQLQRVLDHIDNRLAVLEHHTTYHLGRPKPLTNDELFRRMEFYGLVTAKNEMNHWPCFRGVTEDDPDLYAACCCGPDFTSTVEVNR